MSSKEKNLRRQGYLHIQNMEDLHYQRRLLKSRIDHQEIMVMYRVRCMWDFLSPVHLIGVGLRAITSRSSALNTFVRTATAVFNFFRNRKK